MEAFVNEPNYTVWSDLSCNLGVLSSLLSHTDFHEDIQEFIRDLFTPIGMKLAWDSKAGEGERRGSGSRYKPERPESRCFNVAGGDACVMNLFRRSPGCPVERSGTGEAGKGGAQTHPGGGQKKVQGPCGGQASPSCRSQKPSKGCKTTACGCIFIHNSEADVCLLLGVFNSAETWRQFHTGHDAEGTIETRVFPFSTIG